MTTPLVFISYSHQDEVWKDRLVTHLSVLEEEGFLRTWNDRRIGAGEEWFEEIRQAMAEACVAVVLVSASSLSSKFIRHEELPRLFERRAAEGVSVFPVILKECLWTELPWLAKLQARPRDGKPLADFRPARRDTELAKIAREILEIVRKRAKPEPMTIASPGPVTAGPRLLALHQLPTPPRDFVGRVYDLRDLRMDIGKQGSRVLIGLFGMGGRGKTTLALKLAEELAPSYPDAQIYLDLKGVSAKPLSATEAMAHVIRTFHPEARLPHEAAAVAGLYRETLHGKRVLLLMDNAATKGQIEPLAPPEGCALLVTSRFRFSLAGLFLKDLQRLAIAREISDRAGEARASWNLGLALDAEDPARGAELMQVKVDYDREICHPDAEKKAARLKALRARIAGTEQAPAPRKRHAKGSKAPEKRAR
jgi:hypothetical protein